MKEKRTHIVHDLASASSSDGSAIIVYSITGITDGETDVVVNYTVSKRYPVQKFEEAMRDYERLHGSGRIISLEDLLEIRGYKYHD